ncbi:hypothetical protein [Calidifontibacillus erzurumensis]|uniref:Uncharacterized protein n=1 Tax=Calidifontibacillus erzurumensis TaxID=2741433 RepID=A0A8J8KDT1_9BACI|nr:hypothetical protein [Calidifontibacillus erzurumensis]NSL51025.1 hypothetical protein [Calidifontibacillus erzurumensis]
MGHRLEKQAEQLIILQRDKEVTAKIREAFKEKRKKIERKPKKWYHFWK